MLSPRRHIAFALAPALVAAACWAPWAQAAPDTNPAEPTASLVHEAKAPDLESPTSRVAATPPNAIQLTPSRSIAVGMRESAAQMVDSAVLLLGVRYRRGGNSTESGFDCSGFTRFIFENSVGLVLPRRADEQAKAPGLKPVQRESLIPGDLVFFNTLRRTFSHVGIYVGEGKFIHSPRSGSSVRVEDMRIKYWSKRFTGARRADLPATPVNASAKDSSQLAAPGLPSAATSTNSAEHDITASPANTR